MARSSGGGCGFIIALYAAVFVGVPLWNWATAPDTSQDTNAARPRVSLPMPTFPAAPGPIMPVPTWQSGPVSVPSGYLDPAPSDSPSPSLRPFAVPPSPQGVVAAFYDAVSGHNLEYAWGTLGGRNMVPSLARFEAGYQDTLSVTCFATGFDGNTVDVWLVADETGGQHTYQGSYTVHDWQITAGTMTAATGTQPASAVLC